MNRFTMLMVFVAVSLLPVSAVCQQNVTDRILCGNGCLPPPSGLIGWWPADGTTKDIQLGNDAVLVNGTTFAAGRVKRAFVFDGINDFVDVPDTPALHAVQLMADARINLNCRPSRLDIFAT
jgi:hypothetical protein